MRVCYLPCKDMWNSHAEKGEGVVQVGLFAILAAHGVQCKMKNECVKRWERLMTVDLSGYF
jgi:hypothetical protein